ncbi:MAG: hypothetical protein QOJ89_1628 [bacterium]
MLIVDDHATFRALARALMEAAGFTVAGEAADGAGALRAAAELQPDIVLLDVQLPDLDGFAVAERLAATPRPPAVVLISTRAAHAYRERLSRTHARGFVAKEELTAAAVAALTEQ